MSPFNNSSVDKRQNINFSLAKIEWEKSTAATSGAHAYSSSESIFTIDSLLPMVLLVETSAKNFHCGHGQATL